MQAADLFPFRQEVRAGTLQAVRHLPDAHLSWKPAAGVHTIMDWLRHLAQSEDWWVQAVVLGNSQFSPPRKHNLMELPQVLKYLEATRGATERLLLEWPAEKLQESRKVQTGYRGAPLGHERSLHWIMGHQFDHERHHRAQIYLYLRLMGLEPPSI